MKSLSLNEIRTRASQFVVEWRSSPGDERQEAQSFVRDLLHIFGITETRAALYEKRVQRSSTGQQGYIDALIPGQLLIEMKSTGKNLGLAEIQALDYVNGLSDVEQPKFILTSDFKKFRLLNMLAPAGDDTIEFDLEQLPNHAEDLAFLAGYQTRSFGSKEQEKASIKAAKIMADLYEALEGSGYSDHEASVFLVRTLFALYADDSGIWERDQFTEYIETRTTTDGSDLGSQLTFLFQVMNQPRDRRATTLDELAARFPYVNGRIFEESLSIPSFDRNMREQLLKACAFNWSDISPAIFGSLFQAIKSPEARRKLGEHYTTEINIRKTLDPLFLDELNEQFEAAHHDAKGLRKFRERLSRIKFMDPACGSGNFIIVAYRELRNLELQVLLRLQALGDTSVIPTLYFQREDLAVQLENMRGIELEEWPARIAQMALRLVDHQANMALQLALGKAPDTLPLDTVSVIHTGNALRLDWTEVIPPNEDVIIAGNPPFIGQYLKSVDQTGDLKSVWGKDYNGYLDYVTGWFKKATDYFNDCDRGRFAFVSTNSITQGQPVPALFKPILNAGWRIRFAHKTFPWTSEAPGAAAVHCVITGFDKKEKAAPVLFTYPAGGSDPVPVEAENINGYLIDGPNVYVEKRMRPLSVEVKEAVRGTQPTEGRHLIVEKEEYSTVKADPVAAKYLRPFVGSKELIRSIPRWCLWLEDLKPGDVQKSTILRERIEAVKQYRENASSKTGDAYKLRHTPHLFRPNYNRPLVPYVCAPRVVSENRRYFTASHFDAEVIANDSVFTIEDADGFLFALFCSSMFITWQKAIGGRLKSDLRFSNTIVWNNLPLPNVEPGLRQQIIEAGQGVLDARALYPDRSLADHYNPLAMDPELIKAHNILDNYVDQAFERNATLRSNEDRLASLLARYSELTYGSK
ncbi:MAG: DNA methyltransferase [Canibacter sp.]